MTAVDHPDHYRRDTGHEAIDVIEAWGLGFNLGNAVKYIARCGRKDGASRREDLEKALWYLRREIDAQKAADDRATVESFEHTVIPATQDGKPVEIEVGFSDLTVQVRAGGTLHYTPDEAREVARLIRWVRDRPGFRGREFWGTTVSYEPEEYCRMAHRTTGEGTELKLDWQCALYLADVLDRAADACEALGRSEA